MGKSTLVHVCNTSTSLTPYGNDNTNNHRNNNTGFKTATTITSIQRLFASLTVPMFATHSQGGPKAGTQTRDHNSVKS